MKVPLFVFVTEQNGRPFYVRDGEYACYPCIKPQAGETPAEAFSRFFREKGRHFYPIATPQLIEDAEVYCEEGALKEFMYDGEYVIVSFFKVSNFLPHVAHDPSLRSLERDVFVKFSQGELRPAKDAVEASTA